MSRFLLHLTFRNFSSFYGEHLSKTTIFSCTHFSYYYYSESWVPGSRSCRISLHFHWVIYCREMGRRDLQRITSLISLFTRNVARIACRCYLLLCGTLLFDSVGKVTQHHTRARLFLINGRDIFAGISEIRGRCVRIHMELLK